MSAGLNTRPQLSDAVKAAINAKKQTLPAKDKVTETNVDVEVKANGIVIFINTAKMAMKGDKPYITEVKTNPTTGKESGGNPVLAAAVESNGQWGIALHNVKLPFIDGSDHKVKLIVQALIMD